MRDVSSAVQLHLVPVINEYGLGVHHTIFTEEALLSLTVTDKVSKNTRIRGLSYSGC